MICKDTSYPVHVNTYIIIYIYIYYIYIFKTIKILFSVKMLKNQFCWILVILWHAPSLGIFFLLFLLVILRYALSCYCVFMLLLVILLQYAPAYYFAGMLSLLICFYVTSYLFADMSILVSFLESSFFYIAG